MTILIPAYQPDKRLIDLVRVLREKYNFNVVVVNDGSGEAFEEIFDKVEQEGAVLLTHKENRGKGAALKTGFKYIKDSGERVGVVTADADGQHLPEDIIAISSRLETVKGTVVLGVRRFNGEVPLRSRFGNAVTRFVFSIVSGQRIYDTQTGLRGFSKDMLEWLCSIPGDRYEYEMNVLLRTLSSGYEFDEIDIHTVYLGKNETSHFNAIRDSVRVYSHIVKSCIPDITAFLLDIVLLLALVPLTKNVIYAIATSVICSRAIKYIVKGLNHPAIYTFYTVVLVVFNCLLMNIFYTSIGIPLLMSKLLSELVIFIAHYIYMIYINTKYTMK